MPNKIDDLINWGELSRLLAGSRSAITRKRISKKHEEKINELRSMLKQWYDSLRP
jgi:hypothetical protein